FCRKARSQDDASSDTSSNIPGDAPAIKLAATTTTAKANVITTTYIGIAINANGDQETFTVPALVGLTGTIYGSPVTKIEGTVTPTKVVTLPWPTLPVGYFFSTSGSGVVIKPPVSPTASLRPNIGVTTQTTVVPVGTPGAFNQGTDHAGEGGTVLEASDPNEGTRKAAKSSLGLMVVLLVGIMWF
ncbi:MAG: hypothetical protein Q9226_008363, partial [Calogaya cf. arnoldii]